MAYIIILDKMVPTPMFAYTISTKNLMCWYNPTIDKNIDAHSHDLVPKRLIYY